MKKIRIGVYGLWRGSSFLPVIGNFEDAEVAALCDRGMIELTDSTALDTAVDILETKLGLSPERSGSGK